MDLNILVGGIISIVFGLFAAWGNKNQIRKSHGRNPGYSSIQTKERVGLAAAFGLVLMGIAFVIIAVT